MRVTNNEAPIATEIRVTSPSHRRAAQMRACIAIGMNFGPTSNEENGVVTGDIGVESRRVDLFHCALMAKP